MGGENYEGEERRGVEVKGYGTVNTVNTVERGKHNQNVLRKEWAEGLFLPTVTIPYTVPLFLAFSLHIQ